MSTEECTVADSERTFCDQLTREKVLNMLPQRAPFRFIDLIKELSDSHAVSEYRFREDEYFYRGHFPDNPVTPGVILLEAMAQTGLVALGIYLLMKGDQDGQQDINNNQTLQMTTLFTDCQADFFKMVPPGSKIIVRAEKVFWRKNKLRSQVELILDNNEVAASGCISGLGVILK